ncbi:MAG TPA: S53 family peptidase [Solirubrobacteraceae bacterium]|jgi:kumamolisin|nr:S53 family peptidase [Solirubrobacteraceae bacterium]
MASEDHASEDRVTIPGSERAPVPDHPRVGDPEPQSEVTVTVYLRPSASLDWVDEEATRPPGQRRVLSREELASAHGARPEDVDAVRAFAAQYGLEVVEVDPARRRVVLRGTLEAVSRAFGAQVVGKFKHPRQGEYRGRQGPLTVPASLAGVITGVFGIDDRPQAHTHVRFHAAAAPATSYTPVQVAQAYGFPAGLTGAGQTVGIIELGGGYNQSDLSTYFSGLGLPAPSVTAVGVDGGSNSPGTDQNADGEVMLDIEVIAAVATGATLAVYFSPNTDQGFIDAISAAVHDTTHKPAVVSISWGGPEDTWTQQARTQMEQAFTEAAAVGVTVTVASGDNGSTDGVTDGKQHVDFPASAPHALACGGTSLQAQGSSITSETVWNDGAGGGAGGGGVSIEFPLPSYQSAAHVPNNVDTGKTGRGVPDISGDADPATGYTIRVDGAEQTIGGTSAVAPLWAALTALLNQGLGRPAGFLQPQLYAAATQGALRDITQGNNGAYSAGPGYDACTGLGSPDGAALLKALGGQAPAQAASSSARTA